MGGMRAGGGGGTGDAICRDGSPAPSLSRMYGNLSTLAAAQLAHVHEALDAGLDLHERAEVGHLGDLALHPASDRVLRGQLGPWIRMELLDAEGEPLVLHVDVQHHSLHLVALLVEVARVLD